MSEGAATPETPCPFCGSVKLMATQQETEEGLSGPFAIECGCGAKGPNAPLLPKAVELWERRAKAPKRW